MASRRKRDDDERFAGNEPYTPESGERDSALPPGFQSTTDPALRTTDAPMPLQPGLSAHDPEVAWDLHDPLARHPGVEADRQGAGFHPHDVGDETGDASSPRPDENVADEIGTEVGVTFEDNEDLPGTATKVGERDRRRWELNPASSEDYADRTDELGRGDLAPPA